MKSLLFAGTVALALIVAGCGGERDAQVLNFYNWSEYMPQEVLDRFEQETGIAVVYTTYDSNEALYAKLKLLDQSSQYDLAVPSTYYVSKMSREGLLAPIDQGKLHGLDQLDPSCATRRSTPITPTASPICGVPPASRSMPPTSIRRASPAGATCGAPNSAAG